MSRMDKKTTMDVAESDSRASTFQRETDLMIARMERFEILAELFDRLSESNWFCEVGEA